MKGLKSMLLKEQQYLETICSKAEIEFDIIIARQIVTGLIFQAMTWS